MLIVTTDALPGFEIRSVLGEALGTAVQPDGPARGGQPGGAPSSATFRVGGDQPAGLGAARREAVERLAEDARRKGANAVIGMSFDTAALGGAHEVCAYGTAVWAEPVQNTGYPQQQQHQQHQPGPSYNDPQHSGTPPMYARNLTIGLHDQR
ncbi:YbjQ family protein [Actinomadura sp. PM05-2]|uniref:YbjQ family protein n=2 Tax=Actinomadura parmotrematis TaxID=2864039 RepID=A0ABS7FSU2_9ACTN|nr:YbjQ family protein [Actinomadura parmotrematis]